MEQKIYQVLGKLDEQGFMITATQITVKETPQSYRVIDSKGTYCYWVMIPKEAVNEAILSDRSHSNNFIDVRYEAYCFSEDVDAVMKKVQEKIEYYHNESAKHFTKVQEAFKNCKLTKITNQ